MNRLAKWKNGKEVELTDREEEEFKLYQQKLEEERAAIKTGKQQQKALARSALEKLMELGLTRPEILALKEVLDGKPIDD